MAGLGPMVVVGVMATALVVLATLVALAVPFSVSPFAWFCSPVSSTEEGAIRAGAKARYKQWGTTVIIMLLISLGFVCVLLIARELQNDRSVSFPLLVAPIIVTLLAAVRMHARQWRWGLALAVAGVSCAWLVFPGWLTVDVMLAVMIVALVAIVQLHLSFWWSTMMLISLSLVGLVQSVIIGNDSLRLKDVSDGTTQMLILPSTLDWSAQPLELYSAFDVFLPAFIVVIAGRIAQAAAKPDLYWAAIAAFMAGNGLWIAVKLTTGLTVPAFVCTVPCIALIVWAVARRFGLQAELSKPVARL
ncbi:MAG TPA: hypothetical protein VFZ58_00095 [Candidatus Saccharimonadales bacterium]